MIRRGSSRSSLPAPHFKYWMNRHGIDDEVFCKLVPTGGWLEGSRKLIVCERAGTSKPRLDIARFRITPKVKKEISAAVQGYIDKKKLWGANNEKNHWNYIDISLSELIPFL